MHQNYHPCRECGTPCIETSDSYGLVCPRCSPTCRDFKPPDFHPAGDWDFPDFDAVELAMSLHSSALTEHACEH